MKTKRLLNTLSIMRVFLISTIGPITRNATIDPTEKVLLKEDAIKASASEQSDITKARTIITIEEVTSVCPISKSVEVFKYVCIAAAIKAPRIKYLPTEKNSSTA